MPRMPAHICQACTNPYQWSTYGLPMHASVNLPIPTNSLPIPTYGYLQCYQRLPTVP